MKYVFILQCVTMSATMPMISLNEPLVEEARWGGEPTGDQEVGDLVADPDGLDEDRLHDGILSKKLPSFLEELTPRLREIVHRYYWLEHTQAEIAKDLGVTQSAVAHALRNVSRLGRRFFGITEH